MEDILDDESCIGNMTLKEKLEITQNSGMNNESFNNPIGINFDSSGISSCSSWIESREESSSEKDESSSQKETSNSDKEESSSDKDEESSSDKDEESCLSESEAYINFQREEAISMKYIDQCLTVHKYIASRGQREKEQEIYEVLPSVIKI